MFSPVFHCEHLHPAKEGLPSQEGGDVTLVPIMTLCRCFMPYFIVYLEGCEGMKKATRPAAQRT